MVSRPPERFSNRLQADPRSERHVSLASATSALVKEKRLLQKIDVEKKGKYRIIKGGLFFVFSFSFSSFF